MNQIPKRRVPTFIPRANTDIYCYGLALTYPNRPAALTSTQCAWIVQNLWHLLTPVETHHLSMGKAEPQTALALLSHLPPAIRCA